MAHLKRIESLYALARVGGVAMARARHDQAVIPKTCKPPTPQVFKARRNGQCPCGSGKKFKHCCRG